MRLTRFVILLVLGAAPGGCEVSGIVGGVPADAAPGTPDGGVVVAEDFGVLVAPRLGDLGDPATGPLTVSGLHTQPGASIVIEVQQAGAWTAVATVTTATTPDPSASGDPGDARFAFQASFDPSAAWRRGGLLHVRARDGAGPLVSFFHDSGPCLATQPTWRARATACGALLARGVVLTSVDGAPDSPATPQRFLDDKGAITPTDTAAYYAAVAAPATVADFTTRYLQRDETVATYYNAGDLGIGREMHCGHFTTAAGDGVGCAVSNYGAFGGPAADALAAAVSGRQSGTHAGAFATVAMIYQAPITQPNAVQFFVYGPDQQLASRALLDTHGDNTSIPNNCLSCHASNATYDPTTHVVSGARFLPFDPASLGFADQDGFRRVDQEDALRRLNVLVEDAGASAATRELLVGFYRGEPATSASAAATDYVPGGWQGALESRVYREAIAPYCRGCHGSRGVADQGDALDFATVAKLTSRAATIAAVVCSDGDAKVHRMPDAEVTQRQFWSGRARAYLAALIDLPACTPR